VSTANATPTAKLRTQPAAAAAATMQPTGPSPIADEHRDVLLHGLSWCATGRELGGPYVDGLRQAIRDLSAGRSSRIQPKALLEGLLFEIGNARDRGGYPFPEGTEDALRSLFNSHKELEDRLDGYFARRAAAKCQDVLPLGTTRWFEYHCNESHDSGDAPAWYRSHEQVSVVRLANYEDRLHAGSNWMSRCEDGLPLVYRARWPDGFEWDVFEDELLEHRASFCRPEPPVDPSGTYLKPPAAIQRPGTDGSQLGSPS